MEKEDMILSIGQYLATARKNKGMSLEEISEKTKIKLRLLQAVEKNRFDDFGGVGYTKAVIDTYAKAVDAKDEKLRNLIEARFSSKIKHQAHFDDIQPNRILIPKHFLAIVLLAILVIIMIITTVQLTRAGIMKLPFQRNPKTAEQQVDPEEDAEIEDKALQTKDESQETESSKSSKKVSIKPQMLQDAAKEQTAKTKNNLPIKLSEAALRDTTDYLKKLMFKNQENPFL